MQKFIVIYMDIKTCLAVSKGYNFILMFYSTWSLVSPCEGRQEVNLSVTFQLTRSGWISQIWRLAQIRDGSWWSPALTSAWRTTWRRQNKTGPYSLAPSLPILKTPVHVQCWGESFLRKKSGRRERPRAADVLMSGNRKQEVF